MAGKIIWYFIMLLCALVFYLIGFFMQKAKEPVGFWTGVEVEASKIKDIEAYNKENACMWKLYSLWFVVSAFIEIWSTSMAIFMLVFACTLGLLLLIYNYKRIYRKYKNE